MPKAYRKTPRTTITRRSGPAYKVIKKKPTASVVGRHVRPIESKFFDSSDNVAVPAAGDVNASLCLISQGAGDSQRLGRKIFPTSVGLKGSLTFTSPSGTNLTDLVRVVVFIDKQANGATATVAQLLQGANYNNWRNLDNTDRFMFLYDKVHTLGLTASGSASTVVRKKFNVWLQLPSDLEIQYSSTTGALTELTSANIGVMSISLLDGDTTLDYISRLRYTD